jgi:hypothetical protein
VCPLYFEYFGTFIHNWNCGKFSNAYFPSNSELRYFLKPSNFNKSIILGFLLIDYHLRKPGYEKVFREIDGQFGIFENQIAS